MNNIDYNTYHKIIINKNKEIKLVLNHINNKDRKMYVCRALDDYRNNCDFIEKGKHYICYFPPTKCIIHTSMNWNVAGYFGMGSIEHSFSYEFNNFEILTVYNSGKHMKNKQTKFCKVPISYVEIIDECEYIDPLFRYMPKKILK